MFRTLNQCPGFDSPILHMQFNTCLDAMYVPINRRSFFYIVTEVNMLIENEVLKGGEYYTPG